MRMTGPSLWLLPRTTVELPGPCLRATVEEGVRTTLKPTADTSALHAGAAQAAICVEATPYRCSRSCAFQSPLAAVCQWATDSSSNAAGVLADVKRRVSQEALCLYNVATPMSCHAQKSSSNSSMTVMTSISCLRSPSLQDRRITGIGLKSSSCTDSMKVLLARSTTVS